MKRFLSLDVFRGIALLLMILLYNQWGDGVFPFLALHKAGSVTLAELLFPTFLFIMGAAMWFSSHRPLYGVRNTRTKTRQMGRIFRRTLILFGLGLLLNWIPFENYFAFVRLPGVLQRIALAYFLAAVLTLYLPRVRASVLTISILLVGYWLLLDSQGPEVVGRVDVALLGSAHLLTPDFDPDGLLSTLPATASVLFGYIAGRLMDQPNSISGGIGSLMVIGVLLAAAGLLLNLIAPMDRALWTPSFVLFAAGCAMVVWSILSFIIEYMQAQSWCEFFALAGTNSLFVYCLSTALAKLFLYWGVTEAVYGFYQSYHLPDAVASLLWSLTMVILCWLITWPLYRAKLYISA